MGHFHLVVPIFFDHPFCFPTLSIRGSAFNLHNVFSLRPILSSNSSKYAILPSKKVFIKMRVKDFLRMKKYSRRKSFTEDMALEVGEPIFLTSVA